MIRKSLNKFRLINHLINRWTNSDSKTISNHLNNKRISTLYFQNKTYAPILYPNFQNLDLKFIENHRNSRSNINFQEINKLISKINNIDKELELQLKLKKSFSENYLKNAIKSDEAVSVREKIKRLQNERIIIYEKLIDLILSLPNIIDHKPKGSWFVIPAHSENTSGKTKHQITITTEDLSNCLSIDIGDLRLDYVIGHLSLWQFAIMEDCFDWWINEARFIPISLSDICKSPIVECCNNRSFENGIGFIEPKRSGKSINPYEVMFLKGSATLEAFCAYFMRTVCHRKSLPIALVSVGNRYENCGDRGTSQTRAVSVMMGGSSVSEMEALLERLQNDLKRFYREKIGVEIVATVAPEGDLNQWEACRYELRTEAGPHALTLASISVIGDFVSRRLMIYDGDDNPLHLVFAEVLKFNSLLECVRYGRESVSYQCESEWFDW